MNRDQIILKLQNYFSIYELVGRRTYKKYGNDSWQFFETNALHCLLIIREGINDSCTINDWKWGGKFSHRGLRTNLQQLFSKYFGKSILYLSGHVLGCAFDLVFKNTSAIEVRKWIVENAHLFPCKIRLERNKNGKPITWTHFDTKHLKRNPKVYQFDI